MERHAARGVSHHQISGTRNRCRLVQSLSSHKTSFWRCSCIVTCLTRTNKFIAYFFGNYHHTTGSMCGITTKSYLFPIAAFRYNTFLSIYKENWSDILKFRQKSMSLSEHDMSLFLFCFTVCLGRIGPLFKLHLGLLLALRFTQCELCYCFKEAIKNSDSLEQKLASVLAYREHLSAQWRDRCICWSLQELALDHMSDVLVIQVDGLDQSKFRLPRDPALRATASSALVQAQRPKIKVHGVWCFGPLDSYI